MRCVVSLSFCFRVSEVGRIIRPLRRLSTTIMPNPIREDITTVDETSFPYVFEQNVSIPLKDKSGIVRANVYRPKEASRVPVLVTYGPYGKDIPYKE